MWKRSPQHTPSSTFTSAAVQLQRYARGWLARVDLLAVELLAVELLAHRLACVLQRYVRGWLARMRLARARSPPHAPPPAARAAGGGRRRKKSARKSARARLRDALLAAAARVLQRGVRGWLARRKLAASVLQRRVREWLARRRRARADATGLVHGVLFAAFVEAAQPSSTWDCLLYTSPSPRDS